MKIMLVNNEDGGFADYIDVADGSTVGDLFLSKMGGRSRDAFLIRVDREEVSDNFVIQEGSRVTITPTNIEGA